MNHLLGIVSSILKPLYILLPSSRFKYLAGQLDYVTSRNEMIKGGVVCKSSKD